MDRCEFGHVDLWTGGRLAGKNVESLIRGKFDWWTGGQADRWTRRQVDRWIVEKFTGENLESLIG